MDIGCIRVGAKADIAIADMCDFNTIPARDPIKVLVSCGTSHNITDTIVNGRILMKDHEILSMDRVKVSEAAWQAARRIWGRIPNLQELSPLACPIY